MDYRFIADLRAEAQVPPDGILSRTLHNDEQLKVVLFGFAAGQELSEHTAGEREIALHAPPEALQPGGNPRFQTEAAGGDAACF